MKRRIYTLDHKEHCRMCGDPIEAGSPVILGLGFDGRDEIACSERCAGLEDYAGILDDGMESPHGEAGTRHREGIARTA